MNTLYRQHAGPPVGDKCPECNSILHVRKTFASGALVYGSDINLTCRRNLMPRTFCSVPICLLHDVLLFLTQVAGPMWSGAIHDADFVRKALSHVEAHADKYGTSTRMKGMLTVAKEVSVRDHAQGILNAAPMKRVWSSALFNGRTDIVMSD